MAPFTPWHSPCCHAVKQAILLGSIFEFGGAVLMGGAGGLSPLDTCPYWSCCSRSRCLPTSTWANLAALQPNTLPTHPRRRRACSHRDNPQPDCGRVSLCPEARRLCLRLPVQSAGLRHVAGALWPLRAGPAALCCVPSRSGSQCSAPAHQQSPPSHPHSHPASAATPLPCRSLPRIGRSPCPQHTPLLERWWA